MGIMLRRLKTHFSIRKSLMYSNTRNVETKDRSPHFGSLKQFTGLYFESSNIKEFNFMRLESLVSKGSSIRFRMKLRHSISVFCLRSVMHRRMFNAHFYAFLCFYVSIPPFAGQVVLNRNVSSRM